MKEGNASVSADKASENPFNRFGLIFNEQSTECLAARAPAFVDRPSKFLGRQICLGPICFLILITWYRDYGLTVLRRTPVPPALET